MDANLKIWLPFDCETVDFWTVDDFCGNEWEVAYGTPTIQNGKLFFNAENAEACLISHDYIEVGGKDFTVDAFINMNSSSEEEASVFKITLPYPDDFVTVNVCRNSGGNNLKLEIISEAISEATPSTDSMTSCPATVSSIGQEIHLELVYQYEAQIMTLYIDGVQAAQILNCPKYTRADCCVFYIGEGLVGTTDNFRFFDGAALHTQNFTPPTVEELANAFFPYYNPGTAESLFNGYEGTTFTNLPAEKSKTGTAFGTYDASGLRFPIPAVKELWIKFDVYSDGNYTELFGDNTPSWYISNGSSSRTGISAYDCDGATFALWSNGSYVAETTNAVVKINELQTVLLHMKSDETNGVIEAAIDGGSLYSYTGDVNHGEAFNDLRFICGNSDAILISNITISNSESSLYDFVAVNLSVDVERKITTQENFSVDASREVSNDNFKEIFFDVERRLTKPLTITADVERVVENLLKNLSFLKVWLPFDESAMLDKCGNTWTVAGTPTIGETNAINGKALQLNDWLPAGTTRFSMTGGLTLGGQDFSVCGWLNIYSVSVNACTIFALYDDTNTGIRLYRPASATSFVLNCFGTATASIPFNLNTNVYFEINYSQSENKILFFLNGQLKATLEKEILRTDFARFILDDSYFSAGHFDGTIDEFQVFDGVALHTEDFIPPTSEYYFLLGMQLGGQAPFNFTADVERKIGNVVEASFDVERKIKWRYVNFGDADDLILSSTILTDLPATKSVTGTAFYQTTRAKCFDIPATDDIWIKFDVYFNGSTRWRAYNEGSNGTTGATAQTNGDFNVWINDANNGATSNVCKANSLRTFLLHMKSGSSSGVIEAWVDGEKIYSYTGDVNHGQDFEDIDLQSDGAGTFFSNVIVSNYEIKFGEGYHAISFDTERRLKNIVEVTADVARNVTLPIVVPLIGEHFNHFVQSVTVFSDSPQRIILPKKGDVYIRAKGEGAVRIYSDVYESGFVTGAMYANLAECRTVFIKASFSQLQVIKAFMHSLDETTLTGDAALDEAINFCTGGLIADKATLVENLMSDLNSPAPYTDYFLINKCGINLDNADTGAITGSDAKSSAEQMTPKGIVPEPIPVEEWVVPTRGSSKTIRGLTVQFPTSGASGSLSVVEKHILAGLNSVWIEQSLILIEKSFGLDFNEEGTR